MPNISGDRYGSVLRRIRRIPGVQRAHEVRKNRRRVPFVRGFLSGGVGAELGVQKGYFTDLLLKVGQPEVLHIVDPWYLLGERWEWSGGNPSTADALALIIRRHASALASGQLVMTVADDIAFLEGLAVASLDWAYVDSSHEYKHTVEELRLLRTRVRPGGIIAGDDWHDDESHRHGGVARAVREFCDSEGLELVYCDAPTQQWAVRNGSETERSRSEYQR
jgi:SAM-dependent methyltransferase